MQFREIKEKLVYRHLVSRPFYLLPPAERNESSGISHINRREYLAYWLLTGKKPPEMPKVMYAGSGGSAKGYIAIGLAKKFKEYGIKFDGYVVASVLAFLLLERYTGNLEATEDFALKIPELLKEKDPPVALKLIDKVTLRYFHDGITNLGRLAHLLKAEKIQLPDGGFVNTNNGFVQTSALEAELKKHLGDVPIGKFKDFRILATDFTNHRLVVLGEDYPDMPAYRAILTGIALPKFFAFVMHKGNMLADSGNSVNFPLITNFYDKQMGTARTIIGHEYSTVVALDLGYEANYNNGSPDGGLSGVVKADSIEAVVRNQFITGILTERIAGATPHALVQNGDRRYLRTLLLIPETTDIPPGKIDIPMSQRRKLMEQGEELGERVIKEFRRAACVKNLLI